jgi:hypothetical protein
MCRALETVEAGHRRCRWQRSQRDRARRLQRHTLFPQPHNCLFVFNWDGQKTTPKWLGSSLSKPFSDFTFANFDNDRALELLSVETRPDGKKCLVCYSYLDFGFGVDWQRGAWKTLRILSTSNNRVLVEADGKQMNISRLRKPVS